MIYIDGNWEKADDLDDLINISREKLGNEFADKLQYSVEILQEQINEKDERIDQLMTENDGCRYEISELEDEIMNLKMQMGEFTAEEIEGYER